MSHGGRFVTGAPGTVRLVSEAPGPTRSPGQSGARTAAGDGRWPCPRW
jgi:hypothetical protein